MTMNVSVTPDSFEANGRTFPVLEFQTGNGKPFSLGAYKLRMLLTAIPEIVAWLDERGEKVPDVARALLSPTTAPQTSETSAPSASQASADPSRIDALEKRLAEVEGALGIILEEISRSASAPPSQASDDAGVERFRSLQID